MLVLVLVLVCLYMRSSKATGLKIGQNNVHKKVVEKLISFVCLFGVLRRFQHCTGHITTGSLKGRGNQYI